MAQSIPSWAVVGARVVCIDADWLDVSDEMCPVLGGQYTLREVIREEDGAYYVRLVEIVNPPADYDEGFLEADWNLTCFRPLVTRTAEQDVAMFAHHLNDVPVTA